MIKIPTTAGEFRVQNGPEIKPNIAYTKNVDFDEEGVIRLSPPMVTVASLDDDADFTDVGDIINYDKYDYKLLTADGIFDLNIGGDFTIAQDGAEPEGGSRIETRVCGYGNGEWLVNLPNGIYEYDDPTWVRRNDDGGDFLCEFPSRQTWVAVVGSSIKQYSTANLDNEPLSTTATGPNMEYPYYLKPTGIAYSNYKVGIATRHRSGGRAFFFVWDGASASANLGVPVDAPNILEVEAYKNSWVVLTSRGQLLYFNGGGWDILGVLPPYYFRANWIDFLSYSQEKGKIMQVEDDIIYINIGTNLNSTEDDTGILKGFYSGVWCYDPKVGLYHRYGLSHSKMRFETLTPTDNEFTSASAHYLVTGDKILTSHTTYYAIVTSTTKFKLATSYDNAIAGTVVTIASETSFYWVVRTDWSQLNFLNNRLSCFKKFDNNVTSKDGWIPIFAGGFLQTTVVGTAKEYLNIACPKFENLGAVTYYKVKSSEIQDTWSSLVVKHRPLLQGDKITIKYKVEDYGKEMTVGEADDETPDTGLITWTDGDTFTFTNAMLDASEIEVGDEVEIQSGAGAGQTAHITSIALDSGTWTVSVDETIRGAENAKTSTCRFDRFKKFDTITKTNSGGQFIKVLGKTSKWIQVKLELRGIGITVEELIINNKTHTPVL